MKKKLQNILTGIIVSIAIFISLISVEVAYAADISNQETYYDECYHYTLENDEATIIWIERYSENITIPSEVGGYPVVSIAENAYDDIYLYGDIVIPESIKRIEPRAFAKAHISGNIYIFDNLEEIGEEAFKGAEIEKVYFLGTEKEFEEINIAAGNESILEPELNNKFDLSRELFKDSFKAGYSHIDNVGKFALPASLAFLCSPFLMLIPPLGLSALFFPVAGAIEIGNGITSSFELLIASIAVLFA